MLAALALAAGILVLTHALWMPPIGAFLIVSDPLQHADAVVPLAGDRARVTYAAKLLERGAADWFVITDMWINRDYPPGSYATMIRRQSAREGVPALRKVVMPGTVDSTYRELRGLRDMAQARGWRSLTIVTSPFHARRARMMAREIFADSGVRVAVVPVADHWYRPDTWWRSELGWDATLSEYGKMLLYVCGYDQFVTA